MDTVESIFEIKSKDEKNGMSAWLLDFILSRISANKIFVFSIEHLGE